MAELLWPCPYTYDDASGKSGHMFCPRCSEHTFSRAIRIEVRFRKVSLCNAVPILRRKNRMMSPQLPWMGGGRPAYCLSPEFRPGVIVLDGRMLPVVGRKLLQLCLLNWV